MENHQDASGDKPVFKNLSGDDAEPETTEIESLCINCNENGITRLLLTKIPFYKEVVIMSFECEKCGYRNNEIQPGGKIEEKGVRITLKVENEKDLNRQVVKSDYTSIKILELDFEIPSRSQKGEVTTVEGVIDRSIAGLQQDQPERRSQDPDTAVQIDLFLAKLQTLKFVEAPFTMVFEDISGNTFVQNPAAPEKDPGAETVWFTRTKEQDHVLGIYTSKELGVASEESDSDAALLRKIKEGEFTYEDLHGEVLQFPTFCPDCGKQCPTNMKVTNIPYFKDVVIMATNCECGHRSNEVKSGGGIEPKGVRIEVKITSREDFSRDLLKSESCSLEIPELKLSVGPYALSGRFTTVEGILAAMREQLSSNGTFFQDSADAESKARVAEFIEELDAVLNAEKQVTLVLDDPAGNSHVQSFTHPEPDPNLIITHYERSFEHNEELGLNDMKTENYSEDS